MRRLLVMGAGPAGCATAIAAAEAGAEVSLVDRAEFPRDKVCGGCLSAAGLGLLNDLGVVDAVRESAAAIDRWVGTFDGRTARLDLPPGIAVSRRRLDPILVRRAAAVGVDVRLSTSATVLDVRPKGVVVRSGERDAVYDVVAAATGLSGGGLNRWLPWIAPPHGPYGLFAAVPAERCPDLPAGVIDMRWNEDGYVGRVHLGDGRVDVAAAVEPGVAGRPADILRRMVGDDAAEDAEILATGPLRRRRVAACGRLIAVGDAAGYVEPFTGEGMTWAIRAGMAAGRLIAGLPGDQLGDHIGDSWIRNQRRLDSARKRRCRYLTSALRRPLARRLVVSGLRRFPRLADPLATRM